MRGLCLLFAVFLSVSGISKPVSIAVSVYPVADIVTQIAGPAASVKTVIPPFANPHHFTPLPSTAVELQNTAVFFGVTPELDGWIRKFLPKTARVFFLKGKNQPNEHIWLYPEGGKRIAEAVADTLSKLYPAQSALFQQNLKNFLLKMDETDRKLARILAPVRGAVFIQYHPAWNAFAAAYGLKIMATISNGHGKEISPRELMRLIQKARAAHVRVVVMGLHKNSRTAETLIREIHGRELRLDALGNPKDPERNTYTKLLLFNAEKLAEALHE
ncbi:MAG: zinc ABC transporter substrate-binding protein [Acidobacteria bacterium]|nr:zinc ABC transporter substrate-binding protein [Acidobacteriota bacterium]